MHTIQRVPDLILNILREVPQVILRRAHKEERLLRPTIHALNILVLIYSIKRGHQDGKHDTLSPQKKRVSHLDSIHRTSIMSPSVRTRSRAPQLRAAPPGRQQTDCIELSRGTISKDYLGGLPQSRPTPHGLAPSASIALLLHSTAAPPLLRRTTPVSVHLVTIPRHTRRPTRRSVAGHGPRAQSVLSGPYPQLVRTSLARSSVPTIIEKPTNSPH